MDNKNLVFENHEIYYYNTLEFANSNQSITLEPTNTNKDNVYYTSQSSTLLVNNIENGVIKFNKFIRNQSNQDTTIVTFIITIITKNGILVADGASLSTSGIINLGLETTERYATYKSGEYEKYLFVKIKIDTSNPNYIIVTISY
jgi:outer membrane protein assembly factor BamB